MTKCLIAVGDAVTPTVVGVSFQWGVAFVGAWVFGIIFGWGLEGVWVAMAIDECLRGLIFAVHFKKQRWKKCSEVWMIEPDKLAIVDDWLGFR